MASFNAAKDLGDLSNKVILVTGGTAGLGQYVVQTLAKQGSPHIFFTGRNAKAAESTIESVKSSGSRARLSFIPCDMSDLKSTAAAGERITRETDRLDWVFCNAGIMAAPPGLSKDGWEIQFAVNHLAHAMLVKKLLPTLQRTAQAGSDVRVIFTTSLGFAMASGIPFDKLNTKQESMMLGGFQRYGKSKLANVLYPAELARRYPNITWVSVHPGVIATGLVTSLSTFNYYFTQLMTFRDQVTIDEGAKNQLWAASAPKSDIVNGEFYVPVGKPGTHTAASKNDKLREELYEWTEKAMAKF